MVKGRVLRALTKWPWIIGVMVMLCISLGSCTFRAAPQPSALVIMVEDLGFGAFSCAEKSCDAFCERSRNAFIIPSTVPRRPMNGAFEPIVARKLNERSNWGRSRRANELNISERPLVPVSLTRGHEG